MIHAELRTDAHTDRHPRPLAPSAIAAALLLLGVFAAGPLAAQGAAPCTDDPAHPLGEWFGWIEIDPSIYGYLELEFVTATSGIALGGTFTLDAPLVPGEPYVLTLSGTGFDLWDHTQIGVVSPSGCTLEFSFTTFTSG